MALNPFRMNDWKYAETLKAVFLLLLAVWALIGLDALGIHLPLLRGVFGVVYLLFVPGILILRALRAHCLGSTKTVLFAVGLSIATCMFTGLLANFAYPLLGIERPLALLPAVGTMSAVIVLLAAVSYWRDRDFEDDVTIEWGRVLTPSVLFLCLVPFIMIFATYAMNAYNTNVALLGALVIIGATAFWVGTSDSFPKERYPLAVFAIAIAMLFFASLISSYVWGWDIQKELYNANLVLTNGVWNASLPGSTNAVTSVTLLAPILSLTSGVTVTWLFKIVYPLIFALVPLGLFVCLQSQTNDKIAFLGAFFVSSLFTFFGVMPALARQEVAELFFVLLLILIVDKYRSGAERRRVYAMFAVFAVSLVVSHYALAIIYLGYIVIAWLLLFLVDNPALHRLRRSAQGTPDNRSVAPRRMLSLLFVLLFAAFTAAWYVSVGSAASAPIGFVLSEIFHIITPGTIEIAVGIGAVVYVSALALIYVVAARRQREIGAWTWLYAAPPVALFAALSASRAEYYSVSLNDVLQVGTLSPLHEVGLALYLVSVLLIVVGLGVLPIRRFRRLFDAEYIALALASFVILIVAMIVPQLAFSINTTRLFQISTLLLAPFCVTGGLLIAQSVGQLVIRRRDKVRAVALKLVAAFFVVLFLFSTGFVYEITHQGSTSFVLNSGVDAALFNEREVIAGQWLHDVRGRVAGSGPLLPIYADANRRALFDSFDLYHPAAEFPKLPYRTPPDAYVYLGTFNIEQGKVAQTGGNSLLAGTVINYADLGNTTAARSKIFDDGSAAIYYRGAT